MKIRNSFLLVIVLFLFLQCVEEKQLALDIDPKDLGQYLFYDKGLSYNGQTSCATCHDPSMVFTDSYRRAFNYEAVKLKTNTPTLLNLQDYPYFSWADASVADLHVQMERPLFSTEPIELGMHLDSNVVFQYLDDKYKQAFQENYNGRINTSNVIDAIVLYINQLQSRNSIYDQYLKDSLSSNISEGFVTGKNQFYQYSCNKCHGGRDFNIPDYGLPYPDLSIRIPSLRNVSLTKPYMHDGHLVTLSQAIKEHSILFENENFVADNNIKFPTKESDIRSIIYFLYALTDTTYQTKSLFLNPNNKSK